MRKRHRYCFLILLAFLTSIAAMAQLGVEVEMHYGTAIHDHPKDEPDPFGQVAGLGLNLAYFLDTTRVRALRVKLNFQKVGGLLSVQSFNQRLPGAGSGEMESLVSLRAFVPGYRAVSLGLGLETVAFWGNLSERFRFSSSLGLARLSREAPRLEWYEQSLDGESVPPRADEAFRLEEGQIVRSRTDAGVSGGDSALRSYQAFAELRQGYQLTPYLQIFIREYYSLGTLGKKFGNLDGDTLLGRISSIEIGLTGRL